jgi:hypothetical protein
MNAHRLPDPLGGGYGNPSGVCHRLHRAHFHHFLTIFVIARVITRLRTSTRSNPPTASRLQGVRVVFRSKPAYTHMTCRIPPTAVLRSTTPANSDRPGKAVRWYGWWLDSVVSVLISLLIAAHPSPDCVLDSLAAVSPSIPQGVRRESNDCD